MLQSHTSIESPSDNIWRVSFQATALTLGKLLEMFSEIIVMLLICGLLHVQWACQ